MAVGGEDEVAVVEAGGHLVALGIDAGAEIDRSTPGVAITARAPEVMSAEAVGGCRREDQETSVGREGGMAYLAGPAFEVDGDAAVRPRATAKETVAFLAGDGVIEMIIGRIAHSEGGLGIEACEGGVGSQTHDETLCCNGFRVSGEGCLHSFAHHIEAVGATMKDAVDHREVAKPPWELDVVELLNSEGLCRLCLKGTRKNGQQTKAEDDDGLLHSVPTGFNRQVQEGGPRTSRQYSGR